MSDSVTCISINSLHVLRFGDLGLGYKAYREALPG